MGRTAYDFEDFGVDNIRSYVRNFELPRPDPCSERDLLFMLGRGPYAPSTDVNKSHQNILCTRHERWRAFENVQHLSLDDISPLKWTNTLPLKAADPMNKIGCVIDPRYRLPEVLPEFYSHAPVDISNMQTWLNLLLVTATRIMHCTMPTTSQFAFQHGKSKSKDNHIFRHFVWSPNALNPHEPKWDSGSVVVAYQPPYVLTLQDLEEFASCRAFPTFDSISDHLSSKYRLWAKIWDTCQLTRSNWFVLTSYTHWVFGAFSNGMRVAFISPVITYSRSKPSILEMFLYWICSAMNQPGTFRLPQVDEPVFAELDIDMEPLIDMPRPPQSESFWAGRDASPAPSAHVDLESQFEGSGSLASCFDMPERSYTNTTKGGIRTWLATCQNARHRMLDEDDLVYRPVPDAELPENTFKEDELRGEWMIPT